MKGPNLEKINPEERLNLKHFKESDFHEVCGMREEIMTVNREPDELSGHGFTRGDRVEYPVFNIGTLKDDYAKGKVAGISGPFVRVGLELHVPSRLRKL